MTEYQPETFSGLPEELSPFTPCYLFSSMLSYSGIVGSKSTFVLSVGSGGQKIMSRDMPEPCTCVRHSGVFHNQGWTIFPWEARESELSEVTWTPYSLQDRNLCEI